MHKGYCKICEKDVEAIKKPMTTMEKVTWGLVISVTLGIALIVFLPYKFRYQKKKYCPVCITLVDFNKTEEEEKKPQYDTSTTRGKVLEKVAKKKAKPVPKKVEEDYYCPFCGSHASPNASQCPACKTKLN